MLLENIAVLQMFCDEGSAPMHLDYNLDLRKDSVWKTATPILDAGLFPFFINEIGLFHANEHYFTHRSDKDDHLLLFTIAGEGELIYRDKMWRLPEGCACLIDCNHAHTYKTAPQKEGNGHWMFYWMHIQSPFCRQYDELINGKGFRVLPIGLDADILDHFLRALDLIDYATAVSCCEISHCVSSMLTKLSTCGDHSVIYPKQDLAIQQAISHLKQHFDQPLNLDELTKSLGLSKYYFIKLFTRHTGVTPYQYLIMHRIIKAKQMLRTTDHKIAEIGRAVGFPDESNFCRTFGRLIGMPPSHYRKTD